MKLLTYQKFPKTVGNEGSHYSYHSSTVVQLTELSPPGKKVAGSNPSLELLWWSLNDK